MSSGFAIAAGATAAAAGCAYAETKTLLTRGELLPALSDLRDRLVCSNDKAGCR